MPESCIFPGCPEEARTGEATCVLHAHVVVTGSWVDDGHGEGGHG